MTSTSWFASDGGCWDTSVMRRQISFSSFAGSPYHLSLRTITTDPSPATSSILNGPAENLGAVLAKPSLKLFARPSGVSVDPYVAATWAGRNGENNAFQSTYALSNTTVTVRPSSDPVTDLILS